MKVVDLLKSMCPTATYNGSKKYSGRRLEVDAATSSISIGVMNLFSEMGRGEATNEVDNLLLDLGRYLELVISISSGNQINDDVVNAQDYKKERV